jgi:hypothetical protein
MSTPTRIHMKPRPGQSDETLCNSRTVTASVIVTSDPERVTCGKCRRSMTIEDQRPDFGGDRA